MSRDSEPKVVLNYPAGLKPNMAYWANLSNWRASRRALRRDNSIEWRKSFSGAVRRDPARSTSFAELVGERKAAGSFRFIVLGDTGEGDRSQYALTPLIRSLAPDWIVINGDVAYPAGRRGDFRKGFFGPYRNLNAPIWALPGNHEYYSGDKGWTFFHTFCTFREKALWDENGLVLVPQPGTYWQVEEPARVEGRDRLVVIGLDTGMKGNLDGEGRRKERDDEQLEWLRDRLRRADESGAAVIVLFHIPSLVHGRHDDSVHIDGLLAILAGSPSVRLVACGHIHNHQVYEPETFGEYLRSRRITPRGEPPWYLVSGGGGAYLSGPKSGGPFGPDLMFPSPEQWRDHAGTAEKAVDRLGLGRWALSRVVGMFGSSVRHDDDSGRLLSFLVVDVSRESVVARQVLMEDLSKLYPPGTSVDVVSGQPRITADRIDALLADDPDLRKTTIRIC